jgi:outer membrane protein OmpA-like peptidoglycan-associated protein
MGSKLTLLLGLLVGAFLTLMCINENKTALSLKHNLVAQNDATLETIPPATAEPIKPVVQKPKETVVELEEPMFSYSVKDTILMSSKLSEDDKNELYEEFILKYCPADKCTQDFTFDKNIKHATWQADALKIASFIKDNHVKNGAISINGQLFNLEGEVQNEADMQKLNKLLEAFDPETFKIENLTTIAVKAEEPVVEVKPSVEQIQEEINSLLRTNPIYFEFNSQKLTQESKDTLDNILQLLENVENIQLSVEGHTDSRGYATYNKALSQKRAEVVKNYLLSNGNSIRKIQAIGYGEERPITDNPREKVNRRVEIHLKRGE